MIKESVWAVGRRTGERLNVHCDWGLVQRSRQHGSVIHEVILLFHIKITHSVPFICILIKQKNQFMTSFPFMTEFPWQLVRDGTVGDGSS